MTKFNNVCSVAFEELFSWKKHPMEILSLGGMGSAQTFSHSEHSGAWASIREVNLVLPSLLKGALLEGESEAEAEQVFLEIAATRQSDRESASGPCPLMKFIWDKDLIAKFDR
jgi:hypothetical protein